MGEAVTDDAGDVLLSIYDRALPQIYGYLLPRCRDVRVAEDLTSETFLAAAHAVRDKGMDEVSIAWLVAVARNKLVDHWRREERDRRKLEMVEREPADNDDPWDAHVERSMARDVLASLGGHHRAALTLRYVDGLPVPAVADALGRTVHATEALLVRARGSFRRTYEEMIGDGRG